MLVDFAQQGLDIITFSVLYFALAFSVVGVIIGIVQTVFHIQDQGLPYAIKMIALVVLISLHGPEVFQAFVDYFSFQ